MPDTRTPHPFPRQILVGKQVHACHMSPHTCHVTCALYPILPPHLCDSPHCHIWCGAPRTEQGKKSRLVVYKLQVTRLGQFQLPHWPLAGGGEAPAHNGMGVG